MDFSIFPKEYNCLLPVFSKPMQDELLSSWIVRLAKDHNLKIHDFCKILFPGVNVLNRDIDRTTPNELIKRLSTATLVTNREISECILSDYSGTLFSKHNPNGLNKWILAQGIYHRQRHRNGQMYCPGCLKRDGETPYFRKIWRLSLFAVCPTCGLKLYDCCPQCGSTVNFYRRFIGKGTMNFDQPICICPKCNFDFRESKPIKVTRRFVRMQKYFLAILEQRKKDFPSSVEYFDVLYQLVKILNGRNQMSIYIRNKLSKSLRIDLSNNSNNQNYFDLLSVNQRLPVLFASYWLLQEFPFRIIGFCRENKIWSTNLLKDLKNPPRWFLDVVREMLYITNNNRRGEKFKKYFSYIRDN